MNSTRVNVLLPEKLLKESRNLVDSGYFSNLSELVREGLRNELRLYQSGLFDMTEKDSNLFSLVKKADAEGRLLSEKDMLKHGLRL